jgi:hypothetical protein
MRRTVWTGWTAAVLALVGGCASGPPLENPLLVVGAPAESEPNPMFVPLGPSPESYRKVFQGAMSALMDFGFQIGEYNNFFEGRIETLPRVAPGFFRLALPGSPNLYDRLLETTQSYRHRAVVLIQPAVNGGYWVKVTVFKELEDLPRPTRATTGAASFRTANTVERKYEVVDPTLLESNWLPHGQDAGIELLLLDRIKRCL